jgi:hypothetical protein
MRKRRSVDKSPHVGRDYLRQNEANAVIEAAGRVGRQRLRDQVLLRLMYRHGLRASEAKHTKWTDFDLTPGSGAKTFHVRRLEGSIDSVHSLDRILGSIIQVPTGPMPDVRKHRSVSDSITAQAVRDEAPRLVFRPAQQALEETLGSGPVPPLLHQDVQHDAMLIHRSPQIVQYAPDADEHLVEVPGVSRLRSAPAQPAGKVGAELQAPVPDTFVRHYDAALRQDRLDVAQAQAEDVIQPDRVPDDLRREPMPGVRGARRIHADSLVHLPSKVQTRS